MFKKIFIKSNFDKYYKDLIPYIKTDKNKQYIAIILTFGASIFFLLFAVRPTLTTIAKLQKDLSDSKMVNEKLTQKINNLSSLALEERKIKDDIPLILEAIPNSPEAPNLIAQIQSIAKTSSINLSRAGVLPINLTPEAASSSSSFAFNTSGQGNYNQIDVFLTTLINMQRIISINSISISRSSENPQILQFDINGNAYYLSE